MDRLTAEQVGELEAAWKKWYADDAANIDVNTDLWRLLVCCVPSLLATAKREAEQAKQIEAHWTEWANVAKTLGQDEHAAKPPLCYVKEKVAEQAAEIERLKARVMTFARTALGKEERT